MNEQNHITYCFTTTLGMNPFLFLSAVVNALLVLLQDPLALDVSISIKTIQFTNVHAFRYIFLQTPVIPRYRISTFVSNLRDSYLSLPALCNTLDAPVFLYFVLDGFVHPHPINLGLGLLDVSTHPKGTFGLSLARVALSPYIDASVLGIQKASRHLYPLHVSLACLTLIFPPKQSVSLAS